MAKTSASKMGRVPSLPKPVIPNRRTPQGGSSPGDFMLIVDQDGRKMAFSSRELKSIKFDGKKLNIELNEPKYQIDYMKYLSLLREGVDPSIKESVMSGVRSGQISIV